MLRYLLNRPIAVSMTFLAIAILGVLSVRFIPISLMPETSVPKLVVEVQSPGSSPLYIERSVLNSLRATFQGLYRVDAIHSIATSGSGQISLDFEFGTDMKMAYIQANEKIDQALAFLPPDIQRPIVKRVLQTDIPIARLQLTSDQLSLVELTQLGVFVVKRRLEQLDGASLIEVNGEVRQVIRLQPHLDKLQTYGVSLDQLMEVVRRSNHSLSQIKVQEGIYQYDLLFDNLLTDANAISQLRIPLRNGASVTILDLATVRMSEAKSIGKHLYNGSSGLVFAIHKQEHANYFELEQDLKATIEVMRRDYPQVSFDLTQNQSKLLYDNIRQLTLSLLLGCLLASGILFVFANNWKSPLLMLLVIPFAMVMSVSLLYLLQISINIISLSGMILGVGILIDNGIILIDNIREYSRSVALREACIKGATEIMPALISSTLTTLCVFLPLVMFEGLAGTLFKEQAFSLAIVLIASLIAAFFFLPLLYLLLKPPVQEDNKLYHSILNGYKRLQHPSFERIMVLAFVGLLITSSLIYRFIPKERLPDIHTSDVQVRVFWANSFDIEVQQQWFRDWMGQLDGVVDWEADVGYNAIYEPGINTVDRSLFYIRFVGEREKELALVRLQALLKSVDQEASFMVTRAKNPYDQLLDEDEADLIVKIRTTSNELVELDELEELSVQYRLRPGLGFQKQEAIELTFKQELMDRLGVSSTQIIAVIKAQLSDQEITLLNQVNQTIPIVVRGDGRLNPEVIQRLKVIASDSLYYPLSTFVEFHPATSERFITADAAGVYQSLEMSSLPSENSIDSIMEDITHFVRRNGWVVAFEGAFRSREDDLMQLIVSFSLALALLFVILAAQFESVKQPLIILAEVPISLSGSLLFLFLTGQSLNLSSMMGIIIMLGIIVNDSILKVDTINRYRKEGLDLIHAIHRAGRDRLKPILMTSLTTILAMVPILVTNGMGSDLQRPLAIAVIGGLIVGTVCSVFLVPFLIRLTDKVR